MPIFSCQVCRTSLSAEDSQVGQLVRCPTCLSTLRVPAPQQQPVGAGVGVADSSAMSSPPTPDYTQRQTFTPPRSGGGKRYGFNCGYCSSRLEATESMAAQEGQCPTCGNNITIPILDRYGRLIDPKTRQIIKQDPHPVHAYAAAGDRAPHIFRDDVGKQFIVCPRCNSSSPINANNCKSCGMPFTMEGTTLEAAGTSNGFCVASLVLGIIGYNQVSKSGEGGSGRGMAIAGMICGGLGLVFGLLTYANRW